ncbi:MAG: hypothetical protein FWF76_01305 [Oscillospiraceae bacterium]|nr:hypothetical protein [Oscillospiraceae bacterium]
MTKSELLSATNSVSIVNFEPWALLITFLHIALVVVAVIIVVFLIYKHQKHKKQKSITDVANTKDADTKKPID